MTEPYTVTWTIEMDAEDLVDAARRAYEMLRYAESRPTHFEVTHPKIAEALGPGHRYTLTVELPKDNPLGRPRAVIEGDKVCCGHCKSADTRCLEDVGRYTRMWVDEDGAARTWCGDQAISDEGANPRIWCVDCEKESQLPVPFEW